MTPGNAATRSLMKILRAARRCVHGSVQRTVSSLRRAGLRDWVRWLTAAGLWVVFGYYVWSWAEGNWPMLTTVRFQTDDARTVLFPFHRYGPEGALANDPIADEMLQFVPPGVWLLYRILVPTVGLLVGAKVVQGVCFAIVLAAGVVLWRSRRAGLAAGLLLVFLLLHDAFAVGRIAGGLPRAFGFPTMVLWVAGAIAQRRGVRWVAAVLAAVTYPSAMLMILGAEAVVSLVGIWRLHRASVLGRIRKFSLLVLLGLGAVLPMVGGDVHTLEQAKEEPAFGRSGRLKVLPFKKARGQFVHAFSAQFYQRGKALVPEVKQALKKHRGVLLPGIVGLLFFLPLVRLAPTPTAALALLVSAIAGYILARLLAFRLYSPDRYYEYGVRVVSIGVVVAVAGQLFWLQRRWRPVLRNGVVMIVMLGVWSALGDGVVKNNSIRISALHNAPLRNYIEETLPLDARIAGHPNDTDNIPLFTKRATMGGYETLQPWFVDAWRRQKKRMQDTLDAMYATDRQTVLRYVKKYGVTHFLVNRHRYRGDFRRQAASFQPLTRYIRRRLRGTKRKELVLARVPKQAIVFKHKKFRLVDVARLRAAWSQSR